MRRGPALPATLLTALALCSCSSDPATSTGPSAVLLDDRIQIRTGEFEIPPGDSFECFYTPFIAEHDTIITRGVGMQEEGGHHLTVYYTMNTGEPEHHPCVDAEMATWRQVTAADPAGGEVSYTVPGLGTMIPAGAQIVLQAHYINLGDARTVNDWVDVLLPAEGEVRELAGTLVIDDENWEVAPRSGYRSTSECVAARDYQVASLLGHMHESGAHYRLELQTPGGTWTTVYETDWATSYSSHPPINIYGLDEPLLIPSGSRLRQTCEWMNHGTDPIIFPREMCVAYMNTFPSTSGEMEFCEIDTHAGEAL